MSIRFILYVVKRIFAISSILLIWGANPRESRLRIYRRNVSSLTEVNRHRPLHLSVKEVIPFIRSQNELSERLYIFATRRIDIFLVIQITSIAKVILVSLDRADILYICRNGVWYKEVVM